MNGKEFKNAEDFLANEWTANDFNKEVVKNIVKGIVEADQ